MFPHWWSPLHGLLVHAGHTHTLREKLINLTGMLGVLLLLVGVVILPLGMLAHNLLGRFFAKQPPPQKPPTKEDAP